MAKKKARPPDPPDASNEVESSTVRRVAPSGALTHAWEAALGVRGFGHLRQPCYRDRKTGELRRSAFFWLYWSHEGQRFQESTHTSDPDKAEEYRRRKFAEIWSGRAPWEPRPEPTVQDILERAITKARLRDRDLDTMQRAVARLLGKPPQLVPGRKVGKHVRAERDRIAAVHFGDGPTMRANRGTEDVIEAYVSARKEQGYANGTINRDLAMLRRAYRVAFATLDEHGVPLVRRVPKVELLEEDNVRESFTTEAEYQAIRAHLPWCIPYLTDLIRVTGWRRNEPLMLTWGRVDEEAGLLRLPGKETKGRSYRDPWPYALHPILSTAIAGLKELRRRVELEQGCIVTHLFFWQDGSPVKSYRHCWEKARLAAGLPNKNIHDFRRSAARDTLRATGDEQIAMRMIGAKTPAIFRRYRIVAQDDIADAAKKLAAFHEAQAPSPQLVLPFKKKG
jgi:integrase